MSHSEAATVIRGKSGGQFDPAVVEAFMAIDKSELEVIAKRYHDVNDIAENPSMNC